MNLSLDEINRFAKVNMVSTLEISFTRLTPEYLEAKMPVIDRTKQAFGLLHGGASAALAETVGSVAGFLCLDDKSMAVVGTELNISHLKSVRQGSVTARAKPIKIGRRIHVWGIDIFNDQDVCVAKSRLSLMVVQRQE